MFAQTTQDKMQMQQFTPALRLLKATEGKLRLTHLQTAVRQLDKREAVCVANRWLLLVRLVINEGKGGVSSLTKSNQLFLRFA